MIAKIRNFVLISVILTAFVAGAAATGSDDFYYGDLDKNYYSFYGGPELSVVVLGSGEVSRGNTSAVQFNIINNGIIQGFKTEKEVDEISSVDDQLDLTIQNMEVENIKMITTAVGITAELISDNPDIKVKTGALNVGSLPAGSTTSSPVAYTIEIGKNVSSGEYNMTMKVTYKHLRNVIYSADAIESSKGSLAGIRNLNASYWYTDVTRELPVTIRVKNETKFEIVNVESDLSLSETGLIKVTYKNVGEETASLATARLSTAKPFSTTDDQSYLGTVEPGQTAVASFKISVDKDVAIADKLYNINSEILYEDEYGNQKISDTLKINVSVPPKEENNTKIYIIAGIVILVIIIAAVIIVKNRKNKSGSENN
jgi:hypothetical protein